MTDRLTRWFIDYVRSTDDESPKTRGTMMSDDKQHTYYMGEINLEALARADKDSDRLEIVLESFIPVCRCGACRPHASDCAVHNGETATSCDCPTRLVGADD